MPPINELLSIAVVLSGLAVMYLLAAKVRLGWVLSFFNQFLWVGLALATHTYGFLLGAFAFGAVAVYGFIHWRPVVAVAPPPVRAVLCHIYNCHRMGDFERADGLRLCTEHLKDCLVDVKTTEMNLLELAHMNGLGLFRRYPTHDEVLAYTPMKPCMGTNCPVLGTVGEHSPECLAEHEKACGS